MNVLFAAMICGTFVADPQLPQAGRSDYPTTALTDPNAVIYNQLRSREGEVYAGYLQDQLAQVVQDPSTRGWSLLLTTDNESGLTLNPVNDVLRAQLDLPKDRGLLVTSVTAGGPAASVGLLVNDILLSIGSKPLGKPEDLEIALRELSENKEQSSAKLALLRNGKPTTIVVKPKVKVVIGLDEPPLPKFYIGAAVGAVDAELIAHLNLPAPHGMHGMVIREIAKDSPAEKAGITVNDILFTIDGKEITDQNALIEAIQAIGEKQVDVELLHVGKKVTRSITPAVRKPETPVANNIRGTTRNMPLRYVVPLPQPNRLPSMAPIVPPVLNRGRTFTFGDGGAAREQATLEQLEAQVKELRALVEEQRKAMKEAEKKP